MDPLANKFPNWSPYTYTYNSPLLFIDPKGMQNANSNENNDSKETKVVYEKEGNPFVASEGLYYLDRIATLLGNVYTMGAYSWANAISSSEIEEFVDESTPDKVLFSLVAVQSFGIGTQHILAFQWILKGPDKSLIPYLTLTSSLTLVSCHTCNVV